MDFEESYIDILVKNSDKESDFNKNKICYVLDTNFLLNALKTVKLADQYIEALKKNKGKIFIPFIVWVEFIYNVDNVIKQNFNHLKQYRGLHKEGDGNKDYLFTDSDVENKIKKYFNVDKKFENNSIGKKLAQEDIQEIISKINMESCFNTINTEIDNSFKDWRKQSNFLIEKINNYERDTKKRLRTIREMIDKEDIYLGDEYTLESLEELTKKAEKRIENKLNPGISDEDLSKEGFKIWKNNIIPNKYGDIFLWLEIIDYIKLNESFDRIIIVSDDTKKGDWISSATKDLFNTMKIEINNINSVTVINHLTSSEFVEQFNSSKLTKKEIEDDLKMYTNDYSNEDTIIVPAKEEGFNKVFLGENKWYSIRILNERIPYIKYIAAYQTAPISAVTHYAKVENIVDSPEDPNKKMVIFEGEAKELDIPIRLGNNWSVMQSSRYTKFEKLFDVTDLDELFSELY